MPEVLRNRQKLFFILAQKIATGVCFRQNGTDLRRDLYHIGALEPVGALSVVTRSHSGMAAGNRIESRDVVPGYRIPPCSVWLLVEKQEMLP
jgi:hypothetical protein